MKPPLVRVSLTLPYSEYRAYVQAVRLLTRLMGQHAPTVEALIQAQLVSRDETGLIDDYLDSIEWPLRKGRAVCLRRSPTRGLRLHTATLPRERTRKAAATPLIDPSRN